jgi:hypothetical protein
MTYGPHYGKNDFYYYSLYGALDYLRHGITSAYDWTINRAELPRRQVRPFVVAEGRSFAPDAHRRTSP